MTKRARPTESNPQAVLWLGPRAAPETFPMAQAVDLHRKDGEAALPGDRRLGRVFWRSLQDAYPLIGRPQGTVLA